MLFFGHVHALIPGLRFRYGYHAGGFEQQACSDVRFMITQVNGFGEGILAATALQESSFQFKGACITLAAI